MSSTAQSREAEFLEKLGAQPCSECGYSLNEIRDLVAVVRAARVVVRVGVSWSNVADGTDVQYDVPADAIANLRAAVKALDADDLGTQSGGPADER